jgi:hypothetical protein
MLFAICTMPPGASRAKDGLLARSERIFRGLWGLPPPLGRQRVVPAGVSAHGGVSGRRRLIGRRRVAKKCAT